MRIRPLVALAAAALVLACLCLVLVLRSARRPASLPREAAPGELALSRAAPAPPPAPARFVPPPPPTVAALPPPSPTAALAPPAPRPAAIDAGAPSAAVLAAASLQVDPNGEYVVKGLPGARPIIAFDPKLWTALRPDVARNRLAYLTYAEPVRACAKAFVLRSGFPDWILGGIAHVRMAIAQGVVRFEAVNIIDFAPSGNPDRPPDQEFLDCYAFATRRLRMACRGCREGTVALDLKLTGRVYDGAGETLKNTVDPDIADSDFWVESAPF